MRAKKKLSREAQLHADWLGMLQPEGLVVSISVLEEAGLLVRQPLSVQASLRELAPEGVLTAWEPMVQRVLGWDPRYLSSEVDEFVVDLPDLGATLKPDAVLRDQRGQVLLLVRWTAGELDNALADPRWPTSPQERFERLLVDKEVPIGLHLCPDAIRLVYAPAGEAPGLLTFPVEALIAADGRLLVDALWMLLGRSRLFTAPKDKRLLPILQKSRSEQERVTVALAGQVEEALRLLLAGFDAANERSGGELLRDVEPSDLYAGLNTVLLRLVFLLYAEDRSLLPTDHPLYAQHYSLTGLAEKLQAEEVLYAGAMDRRVGAWARLLTLFRLIHSGGKHRELSLPPRKGALFDPGRYPFLEGRVTENWRQDRAPVPEVSDEVVTEVLSRLLYLGGQRISYRNLEVEQIGSVYEALMGFSVERAHGPSVLLKQGVVVELHDLREAADPVRHLAELCGEKVASVKSSLGSLVRFEPGDDIDADLEALQRALAPWAAKDSALIPSGHHYLQPGEERRRSGSHYTPRSLTEPIVERTLAPVLERDESPEAILALKVCDPAMGSGAFLAEACRFLARRLVDAWARTGTTPEAAIKQGPELHAKRLIAERCLYGVDKNPFAVQLARLSLWLVTSARDLPFTFVDHALKDGDAIIGLSLKQIAAFDLAGEGEEPLFAYALQNAMRTAARSRAQILEAQQELFSGYEHRASHLRSADEGVWDERVVGDLVLACVWAGGTKGQITKRLKRIGGMARAWYPKAHEERLNPEGMRLREEMPNRPFHWELEFPEVFTRKNAGFDAVLGNPPFITGRKIKGSLGEGYRRTLDIMHPKGKGNADYVAYFFLRSAAALRKGGTFGLVATNTLKQGDTKDTGLAVLVKSGITLYEAVTDQYWPVAGAAVMVDRVHGIKGAWTGSRSLNGEAVECINSELRGEEEHVAPVSLAANRGKSFQGAIVLGKGFMLDPDEADGLVAADSRNAVIVRPYIGGDELNSSPTLSHSRFVINFLDRTISEAEAWPDLLSLLDERVRPERQSKSKEVRKAPWWQLWRPRAELFAAVSPLARCIVTSRHSKHFLMAYQPTDRVFSEATIIFPFSDPFHFALLQSRVHEHWARAMGSSMKSDLRYTPSRCFETFPFPRPTEPQCIKVAETGEALYTLRSEIMLRDQQGMTEVWNRLVNEENDEPEIEELRCRRHAMDKAVLEAYGWGELEPDDRDSILRRLRKLNAERAAEEAQAAKKTSKAGTQRGRPRKQRS